MQQLIDNVKCNGCMHGGINSYSSETVFCYKAQSLDRSLANKFEDNIFAVRGYRDFLLLDSCKEFKATPVADNDTLDKLFLRPGVTL